MNEELNKILENLCRLDGVRSATLLLPSGDIAGNHTDKETLTPEQVRDITTHSLVLGEAVGERLQRQKVTHSYLEFGDYSIVAEVIDTRGTLVIVTDPDTNLGRLRLEIRKNRKVIDTLPL